jgi:glycerol uptake facilitator-like aquaporin
VIGQAGSEKLAMMFIPVSPHPWVVGIDQKAYDAVPIWTGFFTEALCTGLLVMFILVLLERRSVNAPSGWFFPFALGLLVCMIVIIDGPLTMTSLNPARGSETEGHCWSPPVRRWSAASSVRSSSTTS